MRRTIWVVTLLALLLAAFVPQAEAFWQCEGRACGTTPWFCCCVSPVDARDANCTASSRSTSESAACAAGCGCVLTIEDARAALPAAGRSVAVPVFHPVLLPRTMDVLPSLPTEVIATAIETRGPPLPPVALAVPSLRAPPAA